MRSTCLLIRAAPTYHSTGILLERARKSEACARQAYNYSQAIRMEGLDERHNRSSRIGSTTPSDNGDDSMIQTRTLAIFLLSLILAFFALAGAKNLYGQPARGPIPATLARTVNTADTAQSLAGSAEFVSSVECRRSCCF